MVAVKRIVLDVLKPHHPNALEFAQAIAQVGEDYQVHLTVIEMDENTETVQLTIEGATLNFERIQETLNTLGGSLHSIDEVSVGADAVDDEG